jgi:membrane protein
VPTIGTQVIILDLRVWSQELSDFQKFSGIRIEKKRRLTINFTMMGIKINRPTWKSYWQILTETIREFGQQNAIAHSASIAFYMIFSLPGILLIIIRFAGLAFGQELVEGELAEQMEKTVGKSTAMEVQSLVKNVNISNTSPLMTLIGILVLIFSATTVFTIIQQALNHMWGVKSKPRKGWLKFIKDRLMSFGMVLALGMLVLVSLILDFFVVIFSDFIDRILPGEYSMIFSVITGVISILVMVMAFTLIFKVLPDARIKWADVTVGAFVTTILFTAGKYVISFYLSQTHFGTTYGAAGSIVLLLLFVNYSSMIMLFGAEFTQVYTKYSGRKIRPSSNAVRVHIQEVESED